MGDLFAILVSGIARSFDENLYTFLERLPDNYHIFLSFPLDARDHFLNDTLNLNNLVKNRNVKLIMVDSDVPDIPPGVSERQRNTIIYWHRLHKLFMNVPNRYKYMFRCRPDVKFLCTQMNFIDCVSSSIHEKTIYIPDGFDTTDKTKDKEPYVNDQVAWGSYESMRIYCEMFLSIGDITLETSESKLFKHIVNAGLTIVRTNLPYKLVLSKCFTIAVCGDSGAGKTTLSELIQEILPYDQTLLFETDRYHKWERGDERYETITHLNPLANHIEKLSTDTFKLCIGDDIHAVDYDHSTGKFTEPKNIKPNKFILFCGLHTLYKESLNDIYNLKIFIDTDPELKRQWKIHRDVHERGASVERVMQSIIRREPEYDTYIKPQRASADIILYLKLGSETVVFEAGVHKFFSQKVHHKLLPVLAEDIKEDTDGMMRYKFKESVSHTELNSYLLSRDCSLHIAHGNFKGLIQYLIISLLWR